MRHFLLLACLCLMLNSVCLTTEAQCSFPTGMADGACTGTTLVDNTTINNGDTYSFSAGPTTFNNLTVNTGGILQVCGTLTVNSLTFHGGDIVIMSGGSLTLQNITMNTGNTNFTNHGTLILNAGITLQSNNSLINYGTLTANGNITVQGTGADLVNATSSAVINVPSNTITLNAEMTNLGTINAQEVDINSGAAICLSPGGAVNVTNLVNNVADAITVSPSGTGSCIKFSGSILANQPLSNTNQLIVCVGPGATINGGGGFGSATVHNNCTTCTGVTLPLVLVGFSATLQGGTCNLSWTTAMEQSLSGFGLEQSTDGVKFNQVAYIAANNKPSTYTYAYTMSQSSFFRLRMVDISGQLNYSKVLYVGMSTMSNVPGIWVTPNPSYGDGLTVHIVSSSTQDGTLLVSGLSGQVVLKYPIHLQSGQNDLIPPVGSLPAGTYTLTYISNQGKIGPAKWVRLP